MTTVQVLFIWPAASLIERAGATPQPVISLRRFFNAGIDMTIRSSTDAITKAD